jgi:hypothetical protein
MINILSILGFGDCLITGYILQGMGYQENDTFPKIRIIGTNNTIEVWKMLGFRSSPEAIIFKSIPAFYNMRGSPASSIVRDYLKFRNWLKFSVANDDVLFTETPIDWRTRFLSHGCKCSIVGVQRSATAYLDRANVLGGLLEREMNWPLIVRPQGVANRILLNPVARQINRCFDDSTIFLIIQLAKSFGIELVLLDYGGTLEKFKTLVDSYLQRPTLSDAINALKQSDRYIGPDSFFMHLAYLNGIPQMPFFQRGWTYFSPPGLLELGNVYYFDDILDTQKLKSALIKFLI